jgi:twitching motility protein PilU
MNEEQANKYVGELLKLMVSHKGSDLFIADDFPPSIKIDGKLTPVAQQKLNPEHARALAYAMMNTKAREEFERDRECNFAINPEGVGRFRVNVFMQQESVRAVVRAIPAEIPTLEGLKLPAVLAELANARRGLVLMAGGTGSGKSTTLAAMINHRNANQADHIITIEDPVEFVHRNIRSLVSHREVGRDTHGWEMALKNALRQAPDLVFIGEIRDRETMEHAISFAETGHLCMATIHANNANQTIDRIVNFFPEEKRAQVLMDLSLNLRAVISQRLVRRIDGKGRAAAIEILLQSALVSELIFKGEVSSLKEAMVKSGSVGMQTFDQALFALAQSGEIGEEEALRNADAVNDLRLRFKTEGKSAMSAEQLAARGDDLTLQKDVTRMLGLGQKGRLDK